ncbi:U3 snoRNP protein [Cichlidogyrus casuarinus]|uniref:U3 snoRNP protein n=1 Tax=Cichlidogyrus casuarinus TaxID=1844966 RepID=A0ABD2QJN3_9PLAT
MAEFVEGYLEKTVTELARLKQLKLFTPDEIETIVKRRRECMYRIQKMDKRIIDYENLISLEISVLRLIAIRRKVRYDY